MLYLDADSPLELRRMIPLGPLEIPLKCDHVWNCASPARAAYFLEPLGHLDTLEPREH